MFEASEWLVFVLASLALVAVPGPAMMFIVARSVEGGRRTGLVTAAGIGLGNLTHALAAAFGVSAVIASTDWALDAVRYLGAGYLVFLGIRGLFANGNAAEIEGPAKARRSRRSDFAKGILVALLNPKVILFLLAFLPQFVDAERGEIWIQLLTLGVTFVVIGWLGDSSWALLSGTLSSRLRKSGRTRWAAVLPSFVYIVLGVATAVSGVGF
ncbi:translocator protein, LysE family [Verrucomicrobiia bacterium DG1235]|nr:translocator protein, LysE family [Verrucomicrobiae bacterium DG1235]